MKILIIKKDVKDLDTLMQGILIAKQYTATIGLTLDITFTDTTKQFTTVPFSNETNNNGIIVNPTEIFQEAKRLGYVFSEDSLVCLDYDSSKIIPNPTNPAENGVNLQIPINWFSNYPEVFASYLLHELCHYRAVLKNIPDLTHLLVSGELQSQYHDLYWYFKQKQPIDFYLYLLKDLGSPIPPPQSTLPLIMMKRQSSDNKQTLGILTMQGFTAKTLELPELNNLPNISCIPKGSYTVKYNFSPRLLKYTYEIQGVPNRTGIRIHSANYYYELLGCIALGNDLQDINHDGKLDTTNSKATILAFETLLKKQPFRLQIL